ncbi:hypothetical protein PF004_g16768 [Phytophthora fragariae]|uniref:Uncharacterized protein n=2 Tax=Phytophthora TaxID=4783 RepID=A0A6G0SCV4_9STRA|nr:hypothetical protein PF004_g16768 [Phytophthora fragariae]KAE9355276.1 hypothetical protein PF008_g4144 [Phytophthora fragariae]
MMVLSATILTIREYVLASSDSALSANLLSDGAKLSNKSLFRRAKAVNADEERTQLADPLINKDHFTYLAFPR